MPSAHLRQLNSVKPATIEWRNNQPYNLEFEDIYFSNEEGLEESIHVFIEGNQLKSDWQNQSQNKFYLAELGFGSGLNFFNAATLWQKIIATTPAHQHKHLHYVSIDKRPFPLPDFKRACNHWPQFSDISTALLQNYPSPTLGRHQIHFNRHRITLTLLYMPVKDALKDLVKESELQQDKIKFDHWFLDGFAPSKNEAMWAISTCQDIARLSKPGTRLATFSVAAAVKTPLKLAGFTLKKRKGIGLKREVLSAIYQGENKHTHSLPHPAIKNKPGVINLKYEQPWFNLCRSQAAEKVAIIGGGIAGCASAYSLFQKGFDIHLFDSEKSIASKASGAAAGIFHPQLTSDMNINSQFNWLAYLYLLRFIDSLSDEKKEKILLSQGVVRLLKTPIIKQALLKLSQSLQLSHWITESKTLTNQRAIFFPHAAALDLVELCLLLLSKIPNDKLNVHLNSKVTSLIKNDIGWSFQVNSQTYQFKHIIFCGGAQSDLLPELINHQTNITRGQTCYLQLPELRRKLEMVLCEKSYLVPNNNQNNHAGFHLGATFEDFVDDKLNSKSQSNIISHTAKLLNEFNLPFLHSQDIDSLKLTGTLGYRLHSVDRLPIIGGVENRQKLNQCFSNLGQKPLTRSSVSTYNQPGLWLNTAYGSHGLLYALIGSQHLASLISNELSPLSTRLANAISPVRFAAKKLKKSHLNK